MKEALEVEATLRLALEALEEIALAGMSPSPEMIDSKEAFHARQAWRFIGIAARALKPIKEALAQQSNEQVEPFGWGRIDLGAKMFYDDKPMLSDGKTFPLYTHPPVPYVTESRTAQREPTKKEHDVLMGALKRSSKVVDNGQTKDPEQSAPHGEPVAWIDADILKKMEFDRKIDIAKIWSLSLKDRKILDTDEPLYTTPPQRKPLGYVDLRRIANQCGLGSNEVSARTQATVDNFARAIEAAHGIKE